MNTLYTVTIHSTADDGSRDRYGNPVTTATETEWEVYGWAPGGSQELTGWSSQVTADLAVYGPPPPVEVTPQARVEVDGALYDVKGVVEDFDHGPFGWAPGVRVNLTRVEG